MRTRVIIGAVLGLATPPTVLAQTTGGSQAPDRTTGMSQYTGHGHGGQGEAGNSLGQGGPAAQSGMKTGKSSDPGRHPPPAAQKTPQ